MKIMIIGIAAHMTVDDPTTPCATALFGLGALDISEGIGKLHCLLVVSSPLGQPLSRCVVVLEGIVAAAPAAPVVP